MTTISPRTPMNVQSPDPVEEVEMEEEVEEEEGFPLYTIPSKNHIFTSMI